MVVVVVMENPRRMKRWGDDEDGSPVLGRCWNKLELELESAFARFAAFGFSSAATSNNRSGQLEPQNLLPTITLQAQE